MADAVIIRAMDQLYTKPNMCTSTTGKRFGFVLSCLTTLAIFSVLQDSPRRDKSTNYANCNIVLISTPYLSTPLTTEQSESLSTVKMTSLFVRQLPLVAATLEALRIREIAFAQIGGLYGP